MSLMAYRKLRTVGGTSLLTLLSMLTPARPAGAQVPAGPPALPDRIYTKSSSFDLPILMKDRATQQKLREVCLYVKAPGANWVKQDTALPTANKFSYRAPQDGEYWFNLVTVDNQGHATPADVVSAPPGLRVVVDTKPPVIEMQVVSDSECVLRCKVQDEHLHADLNKVLTAVAHGPAGEVTLETVSGQPGVFRVRPELMSCTIRVTAMDLAKNTATREVNVKDVLASAQPAQPAQPAPGALPPSLGTTRSLTAESPVAQGPPTVPTAPTAPTAPTVAAAPSAPTAPVLAPVAAIEKPMTPALPAAPTAPAAPAAPVNTIAEMPTKMPLLPSESQAHAGKGPANRRIINSTHASIDYKIDHKGPSGIGKVEVYVSHDEGKNWRRAGEDVDRTSPAEIDLPGEGLFGIHLAITNGNGFGGTPPAPGTPPQVWVEVDTTPPFVQLRSTEIVGPGGAIDIRWSASDPNLSAEPVTIYYRTRSDGPWQPIAKGIKNEGCHRWTFPHDAGSQFFFKIEVADQAGNIARAESQTPITLDMTEPRASVISVTGTNKGQ